MSDINATRLPIIWAPVVPCISDDNDSTLTRGQR
uniref:MSDIN-like toxin proprotein 1 n=2 Tax=Amanita TaxID=41955 RepID=MSD1_AMAFU|nr:RecName: Full=MSDIN-like toxin proprotein 1; Contains: RecName: Full=Toxin MSD1; Flags: Precursor [Amanita fuliginea]U5L409.1 RecName: Full=MSDIN-like toxin proprotein 2; Contains: RecName: Full=Toxin MSD2; Flags: Precursor [Amanita exitialis]AGW83715.1 MSDIN_like 2 peptide 2 [Amanita exitialis]AHB18705.1 MSDIN-like protein [Amanita fuliginea]